MCACVCYYVNSIANIQLVSMQLVLVCSLFINSVTGLFHYTIKKHISSIIHIPGNQLYKYMYICQETVSAFDHILYVHSYGTTTQIQLHTCAQALLCQHACVNMLPVTCDGVLASLTYCTCVLHEGLHTRMCYSSAYSCVRVTRMYNCMCNTSTFYKKIIYIIMYVP